MLLSGKDPWDLYCLQRAYTTLGFRDLLRDLHRASQARLGRGDKAKGSQWD